MINYNSIRNKKIISFDIFDTLIKRNVSEPKDIFNIVEYFYNLENLDKIASFQKNRISAESKARLEKKNNTEEITIDDIYFYLEKIYGKRQSDALKKLEIDVEISFSEKNNEVLDLFNLCKKTNRVIITSDIYLSQEVIEKILEKNGVTGYEKIYISSEIGKTKATGSIFDYIINDLNVKKSDIIHIGDNKKSDFISPIRKGISARLYRNNNKQISIIDTIVDNNKTRDYYYNFGYKNLGPLLVGLSKWLNKNIVEEKIEKIYFLSRDGNIMKKAYDILFKQRTYYIYASRRSLIVPSLWKAKNNNELFSMMNLPKVIVLKHLIERLGYTIKNNDEVSKFGLNSEKEYNVDYLLKNQGFNSYIDSIKDEINDNSKREFNNLKKYLNKNDFSGKVAIVDIGWYGSMQKALERLFDVNILGYYVGIHSRRKTQTENMHGFIFETNKNECLDNDELLINSIVEFIFSTFHGSTKRFTDKGEAELYEYEYDNTDEKEFLKKIQNGAIDFVKKINDLNIVDFLNLNEIESSKRLFNTCLHPSREDSYMLGKLNMLDNGIFKIGTEKNIVYYLFHPKLFFHNFKKSTWKIGFLKKVFIIPCNYYKIVKLLKNKKKG